MARKPILKFLAGCGFLLAAGHAAASECEAETLLKVEGLLQGAPFESGVMTATRALLSQPRFYEDTKSGASCTQPRMDQPGYPAIPVKECTYQRFGSPGWVMVANPGADVVAKWISAACLETSDSKVCAARVAAHVWCASQFSFPIAGNLIQPRKDGQRVVGVNTAYVNGVPLAPSAGLTPSTPVSAAVQKQRFLALASSEKSGDVLTDRGNWPAGVSPASYARFAGASKVVGVGNACSADTWRQQWSSISRTAYNQGWRNGRNSMFDAAAKALMADARPDAPACR